MGRALVVVVALLLLGSVVDALIHKVVFKDDVRSSVLIESFGFDVGGFQNITTGPVVAKPATGALRKSGFCFIVIVTAADNSEFLDDTLKFKCDSAQLKAGDIMFPISWDGKTPSLLNIDSKPNGFYNLYFVNEDHVPVSFTLEVTQFSRGTNYLSLGKLPLGKFYMVDSVVYLALALYWSFGILYGAHSVFLLHHLMAGVVLLKMVSVLFLSLDFHFQNIVGHPGGWTVAFYVVNFIKGISLFLIVGLIGTGWQFIKPFLSDKDKQIFLFVLPLQVLDNIALVIIDESIPGVSGWETWKTVFRVVDIICCGAIIIPIIWSIKHLRDAAQASGKMARNLHKLQLFRQYYLIVVSYIYFTRIIVYLFEATLPYTMVWLSDVSTEFATIAFFIITGYRFMPEQENPFLKLDSDEEVELTEEGEVDLEAASEKKASVDKAMEAQSVALQEAAKQHTKEATFQADL